MAQSEKANKRRRRPGRDPEEQVNVAEEAAVEESSVATTTSTASANQAEAQNFTATEGATSSRQQETSSGWGDDLDQPEGFRPTEEEKTRLEFYGSELIRLKAPKVMEVADQVVHDWTHEGSFEGLPVGNPLAQIAVAKGLQSAKKVEKKLEEKGVFMMAKIGYEFAKSKLKK